MNNIITIRICKPYLPHARAMGKGPIKIIIPPEVTIFPLKIAPNMDNTTPTKIKMKPNIIKLKTIPILLILNSNLFIYLKYLMS